MSLLFICHVFLKLDYEPFLKSALQFDLKEIPVKSIDQNPKHKFQLFDSK